MFRYYIVICCLLLFSCKQGTYTNSAAQELLLAIAEEKTVTSAPEQGINLTSLEGGPAEIPPLLNQIEPTELATVSPDATKKKEALKQWKQLRKTIPAKQQKKNLGGLSAAGKMGIISICLAILSFIMLIGGLFALSPGVLFVGFLFSLAAVITGIISIAGSKKGETNLQGLSITGIVLGSLVTLIGLGLLILVVLFGLLF